MTQTIKVHKLWRLEGQEEITELNLQAAKKLIENCNKWNCLAFDTKTREVIRELPPNVDAISILLTAAGGG